MLTFFEKAHKGTVYTVFQITGDSGYYIQAIRGLRVIRSSYDDNCNVAITIVEKWINGNK